MRNWLQRAREKVTGRSFFHLHLISDSTGETLLTAGRAAASQYPGWRAIEHVAPMVRSQDDLDKALKAVDRAPGIVLHTLVDETLNRRLRERCAVIGVPTHDILAPVMATFDSFLGDERSGRMGAQHKLDEEYFGRLEAIRFAMEHDDGNLPDRIADAEIIVIGISRTSKTPTSIYLAQRGYRAMNIPLVPGTDLPTDVLTAPPPPEGPLVVALVASAERILQVRENRLLAYETTGYDENAYINRAAIAGELAWTRDLCRKHGWPIIDVSKRSVEETAAAILALQQREGAGAAH